MSLQGYWDYPSWQTIKPLDLYFDYREKKPMKIEITREVPPPPPVQPIKEMVIRLNKHEVWLLKCMATKCAQDWRSVDHLAATRLMNMLPSEPNGYSAEMAFNAS